MQTSSEKAHFSGTDPLRNDLAWTCNAFAWLLAVSSDNELRDGKKAVEYAREACELTAWRESQFLDTLAAAYAETGQFEEALKWEQRALDDANYERKKGEAVRQRIKLYEQRQPYREK